MKFSANSKVLEKLLSKIFPAVPVRTPMQILENFLFEIDEGKLTVTATDLEIVLRSSINIEADENTRMIIPAKLMVDIVKSLPDTVINFETDKHSKLHLKTDNGLYSIGFSTTDEYPDIPEVKEDKSVVKSGKVLDRALEKTSFAISREAMRPAMMGTLMEFSEEGLKFVTTDGHRLVKFIDTSKTFDFEQQIIIPERAISVMSKLLSDSDVQIHIGDSSASFIIDDLQMITRLIAQKYPDYNSVIPVENDKLLKIDKSPLQSAIKRMLLFATSTFQQVKFSISKENVEISAEDADRGSSARENIKADYNGEPLDIGFNTAFLNDILTHIDDKDVVLKLQSATKACIIEPSKKEENEDILMLLMPVRLNS